MNTPAPEVHQSEEDSWVGDRPPDPALFFNDAAQIRLLHLVSHLAENTEDVALIVGAQGAGKTTLLYRIQGNAQSHWLLCRVDANPMLHPDQLLRNLARRVEVRHSESNLTERLANTFSSLRLQGRLPVVVVDDADQLPTSSLMALLRLHETKAAESPAFALILLADPAIDRTLTSHQLHAMGTARIHRLDLPLLTAEEISDYVAHFLHMEGVERDVSLRPELLARIHRDSGGLPGRVNELVIRALRDPDAQRHPSLRRSLARLLPGTPGARLLAGAGIAALAVLGLLMLLPASDDSTNHDRGAMETPSTDLAPAEAQQRVPALPPSDAPAVRSDTLVRDLALPPTQQAAEDALPSAPPAAPPQEHRPTGAPLSATEPSDESPVVTDLSRPYPPEAQPAPLQPTSEQGAGEGYEPLIPPRVARREPAAPAKAKPPAPKPKPMPANAPVPPPTPSVSAGATRKEAWILQQAPDAYTLQVLGVGDERAVARFSARHRFKDELFYFETRREGRPWYALLHGLYPNRGAAVAAMGRLPPEVRKAGAWPRSIGSVQEDIRRRGH